MAVLRRNEFPGIGKDGHWVTGCVLTRLTSPDFTILRRNKTCQNVFQMKRYQVRVSENESRKETVLNRSCILYIIRSRWNGRKLYRTKFIARRDEISVWAISRRKSCRQLSLDVVLWQCSEFAGLSSQWTGGSPSSRRFSTKGELKFFCNSILLQFFIAWLRDLYETEIFHTEMKPFEISVTEMYALRIGSKYLLLKWNYTKLPLPTVTAIEMKWNDIFND